MRRNKILAVFTILFISVFLLTGCFQQDEEEELTPKLSVSNDYLHASIGNSDSFMITNDGNGDLEWEIDTDAEWLVFNKEDGSGSAEIVVSVTEEASENDSAVIEVSSNAGSEEIDFVVSENQIPDVQEFDVRGITAPEGEVSPTIINNVSNNGVSSRSIDVNDIEPYEVPEGYETGFIFSWEKVNNVDGYEIYVEGEEGYELLEDLKPSELEEVEDSYVYTDITNDDITTVKSFKIRAYVSELNGNYSVDEAVILPETTLETPAMGDEVLASPLFVWDPIDGIAGYQLMISENTKDNVIHRKNGLDDAEYQYNDTLVSGDYLWGVLTVGEGENANGLSLSKFNDFSVE